MTHNHSVLDTSKLLEPQIPHAIKLLNSLYLNGVACDLSETGVGKTFIASWIAQQFKTPIVTICPKSVIPSWNKTLNHFGIKPFATLNYEKIMRGGTPYVKYRLPNIDPVTGKEKDEARHNLVETRLPTGSLVILDEAHKCKGSTSLNSGLMISLKKQGYKTLTLSATQAMSPIEMRAFGFFSNLHNLHNWKAWCLDNGAQEVGHRKILTFSNDDDSAKKKMLSVHDNLFNVQKIASRLTRDEMGSLFPENQTIADAFDLGSNSAKIQSVYQEMEYEIDRLNDQCENYSSHVFAEIIKARRKAELLKIPIFHDMIEDLYDEGKSVVVFLNFSESISALSDRLIKNNINSDLIGFIHGNQTFNERNEHVDEFQSDKKRILICNIKAGGVALSLHDLNGKHPRASLISPSFSAVDLVQSLGRVHRQGGLTKSYQRIVFAANCIEEMACNRVQSRLNNLSCLMDGDLSAGFNLFS